MKAITALIDKWNLLKSRGQFNERNASLAARDSLSGWFNVAVDGNQDRIDHAFSAGYTVGEDSAEVQYPMGVGDDAMLDWLKKNKNGFIEALDGMSSDGLAKINRILRESMESESPLSLITQRVIREVGMPSSRAALIVRTEIAKASALGKISAWGKDRYRDWYNYIWIVANDDKVKDVSLLFERGSPYTWSQMRHLWTEEHNKPQRVRNRHTGKMELQTSSFNCRCQIARTPKDPETLYRDGKISGAEKNALLSKREYT
jgi:hypothetical protein